MSIKFERNIFFHLIIQITFINQQSDETVCTLLTFLFTLGECLSIIDSIIH